MTDNLSSNAAATSGVSPVRKCISSVLLLVLLVILAIEVRAIVAQKQAGEALAEIAPDGVFDGVSQADVEELLTLSPSRTQMWSDPGETEYRYGWLSVLRPVLKLPETAFYVVVSNADGHAAKRYSQERPTDQEMSRTKEGKPPEEDAPADDDSGHGSGDQEGGEFDGEGEEPQERRRPPLEDASPDSGTDEAATDGPDSGDAEGEGSE